MSGRIVKDRYELDCVARAVVTGERGLGALLDRLADDAAALMINRLAAVRAPGLRRVAHLKWRSPSRWRRIMARYDADLLRTLLARVEKHLAVWLWEGSS